MIKGLKQYQPTVLGNVIITVDALRGGGKTHFLGSLPDLSVIMDFDMGLSGVLDKFTDDRQFQVADYGRQWVQHSGDEKIICEDIINDMEMVSREAIDTGVRAVAVDTGSKAWACFKTAQFGDRKPDPSEYEVVNIMFERFINQFKDTDTSLIMTHHLSDKWIGKYSKVEGEYTVKGYSKVENCVQACINLWEKHYRPQEGETGEPALVWVAEFRKSRLNPDLLLIPELRSDQGEVNFPTVAALVTDSDPEDWQ